MPIININTNSTLADVLANPQSGSDNYALEGNSLTFNNVDLADQNFAQSVADTAEQDANTYSDSKVADSITNGVTTIAPSQNAVFDALALKQDKVSGVSDTEIGYLDGVTSSIQTQFNNITSGNVSFKRISGYWYSSAITDLITSTASLTRNVIRLTPFIVSQTESFDRIAMEISGAGTAGSLVLLGIYQSDANGFPTTALLNAGTILGDSSTNQTIVINQQLTPGVYWLAYTHNSVANISFRTIQISTGAMPGILGLADGNFAGNQLNLIQMIYTYDGTFPTISGATITGLNAAIVALRKS